MSGTKFVLDTNALIYLLKGEDCVKKYHDEDLYVSVITKIELLSFHTMTDFELQGLQRFLAGYTIIPVNDKIVERTINLRRKYRTKLPDTIVAATAIALDYPLVTADKGFRKIE